MPDLASVLAAEKFWILDPLYVSLGTLLAWFFSIAHSYGLAIILLTVVVRLVTLPLTVKQARSQQELQRVQPELKRIQAKYKNDRQKLNEEMMKFYKENHVNPFGGCLPVLVQFPVLIVLYRLIMGLIDQPPKHVPEASAMYADLVESGGEMVSFGMDLAKRAGEVSGGKQVPFLILIALVMATGYYQQRQMTARLPKESRTSQMVMIGKIFPIMFGVISWTIPAAVVVYFLISNLWQIGQQGVMFRKMPLAAGTEKAGKGEKGATTTKGAKGKADPSAKKGSPTPKRTPGSKAGAKGGKATPKATPKAGTKGGVASTAGAKGAKGAKAKANRPNKPNKGAPAKGAQAKPTKGAASKPSAAKAPSPAPSAPSTPEKPTDGAAPAPRVEGNGQAVAGRRRRRGRGSRTDTTPPGGDGATESSGGGATSGGPAPVADVQKDDE